MLTNSHFRKGLNVLLATLLLAACASPKTPQEAKNEVQAAEATLANFLQDPDMAWLQKNIHNAKAVLISPRIMQAGLGVGGSGGTGVVLARTSEAQGWNGPAFYKLATATVGLQAGAQSSEMVALAMTDKAMNSLLSNSFKIGGDVSVTTGPVGASATGQIASDMVIFVRSKGLYGGLNLDGAVITVDDKGNRSFYGRAASPVDILVKRTVSSPDGASLARLATRGATGAAGSPGSR